VFENTGDNDSRQLSRKSAIIRLMVLAEKAKPKGEHEVRQALLMAAVEAYSAGFFSVRKIAQRAGVNHGQVHHYFGGLNSLKRRVLETLGEGLRTRVLALGETTAEGLAKSAARAVLEDRRFVRALARQILDDDTAEVYQIQFPVVEKLQHLIGKEGGPATEVELAEGLAQTLGWAFFEPWIRQALSLSDEQVVQIEKSLIELDEGGNIDA